MVDAVDDKTNADAAAAEAAKVAEAAKAAEAAVQAAEAARKENMVPQSRLDKVTAEKWEERRAREAAESELARARQLLEMKDTGNKDEGKTQAQTTEKPLSREELQRLINEQANEQNFNKACNDAVLAGRAKNTDFDKIVMGDLAKLSPVFDPRSGGPILPRSLIQAALSTGQAGDVLYALGKDQSAADRIMSITDPIAQAVEVTKFHIGMTRTNEVDKGDEGEENDEGDKNVSHAPPPIKPKVTHGTRQMASLYQTEKTSTKEWIQQREAELARNRQNGARR